MIHASLWSTGRVMGVWLLAWIIAVGCDAAANRRPEVTLLTDPAGALVLGAVDFEQFTDRLGAQVAIETIDPDAMTIARVQAASNADVVLVADYTYWTQLDKSRRIDPPPWRFMLQRDRIAVATTDPIARIDTDTTSTRRMDARIESFESIVMADPLSDQGGRMAKVALQKSGLWERWKPKVRIAEGLEAAADEVLDGHAKAILLRRRADLGRFSSKLFWLRIYDPYPEAPNLLHGGVLSGSDDPRAALQLWNYLERGLRQSKYGYMDNDKLQITNYK